MNKINHFLCKYFDDETFCQDENYNVASLDKEGNQKTSEEGYRLWKKGYVTVIDVIGGSIWRILIGILVLMMVIAVTGMLGIMFYSLIGVPPEQLPPIRTIIEKGIIIGIGLYLLSYVISKSWSTIIKILYTKVAECPRNK